MVSTKIEDSISLFAIENPIMDISVDDPDRQLLDKYKLELGMACLATPEQLPIYEEAFKAEGRQLIPGGSALNSARACQHSLKGLGSKGKVAYAGCIGKDEFGAALEKAIDDAGMHGRFAHDETKKTGTCAVVVVGKERTLCADLAACTAYPMQHLTENMVSLVQLTSAALPRGRALHLLDWLLHHLQLRRPRQGC